jgi:Fe-S-cluster containining protein
VELADKVKAVERVFHHLDEEILRLQQWSTLHCKAGCGKCCFKADIEATILEFLPFAFHLYQQDKAEAWYERLKETDSSICLILNPTQAGAGLCSQYPHRGLICRLFGYSARTNKYDKKELITCQIIKTEQEGAYKEAEKKIEAGNLVPVMSDYYMQLHGIDFELTKDFYPINQAIQKAIEVVMQYYAYR